MVVVGPQLGEVPEVQAVPEALAKMAETEVEAQGAVHLPGRSSLEILDPLGHLRPSEGSQTMVVAVVVVSVQRQTTIQAHQ